MFYVPFTNNYNNNIECLQCVRHCTKYRKNLNKFVGFNFFLCGAEDET